MTQSARTLSEEEVDLLNTAVGKRLLFAHPDTEELDLERTLRQARYELRLRELQAELIAMQSWVIKRRERGRRPPTTPARRAPMPTIRWTMNP